MYSILLIKIINGQALMNLVNFRIIFQVSFVLFLLVLTLKIICILLKDKMGRKVKIYDKNENVFRQNIKRWKIFKFFFKNEGKIQKSIDPQDSCSICL